jgi:hypothetical protein
MASPELESFLKKLNPAYKQYAQPLNSASFTDVAELAAATPELLETRTKGLVPIGPAGAIVAAAKNAGGGPHGKQAYLFKDEGSIGHRGRPKRDAATKSRSGGQQPGETAGLSCGS